VRHSVSVANTCWRFFFDDDNDLATMVTPSGNVLMIQTFYITDNSIYTGQRTCSFNEMARLHTEPQIRLIPLPFVHVISMDVDISWAAKSPNWSACVYFCEHAHQRAKFMYIAHKILQNSKLEC
jgi:uncharacterized membrane protein